MILILNRNEILEFQKFLFVIHFCNLRKLLVDINSKNIDNVNMTELSMGMTGDYEIAIEEGATFVRVGTGIFGSRQYAK